CLEFFMINEIETSHGDIVARLQDHFEDEETELLHSEALTSHRYFNYSKVLMHTPLVYPATLAEKPPLKNPPRDRWLMYGSLSI
ncbi:hypothetical protein ACQP3F_27360, partial [Escherichia coli]